MDYSQTGETDVIRTIFDAIGEGGRFLVDIGAGDGRTMSNTRALLDDGWTGARFDLEDVPAEGVMGVRVTAENVEDILGDRGVPDGFDFLSLDVDGVDWWVMRAILRAGFVPRVVCVEINATIPRVPPATILYNPDHRFDDCNYYGASLGAWDLLFNARGYRLVHVQKNLNAFYALEGEMPAPSTLDGLCTDFEMAAHWPPDRKDRPWALLGFEDCL